MNKVQQRIEIDRLTKSLEKSQNRYRNLVTFIDSYKEAVKDKKTDTEFILSKILETANRILTT